MNHEETRGLVEVALHWEGALHKAVEDTGLNFMAKADLVKDIQFRLADGSTALASALLDALERIEELERGLQLTRSSVAGIMVRPGCPLLPGRNAKMAALAEIDAALSPGEAVDLSEEATK